MPVSPRLPRERHPSSFAGTCAGQRPPRLRVSDELAVARGNLEWPHRDDPQTDLIRLKGVEHEAAYLEQLRDEGRDVVEIWVEGDDGEWDWQRAAREIQDAMHRGSRGDPQAALPVVPVADIDELRCRYAEAPHDGDPR